MPIRPTNEKHPSTQRARRVAILGSTGSIGTQTIEVIERCNARSGDAPRFEIVALAAGSDCETLCAQARAAGVKDIAISDTDSLIDESSLNVRKGSDAARRLIEDTQPDLVVAAIVGIAGLDSTLSAARAGIDIALANKESLVAGGSLVIDAARESGARILPIDSEHAGVWQCLLPLMGSDYTPPHPIDQSISRITLTASGGAFRDWTRDDILRATPADALKHPNWSMGAKVTIDCASLMNKGLELLEAHWLFDVDADQLDAVVHPQSIVHAFVECRDGSTLAQLGAPDMRCPIQHALCFPDRATRTSDRLDLQTLSKLDFEPVDHERFPAVRLATNAITSGGNAGAVLNGANEIAARAFLDGSIRFPQITEIVASTAASIPNRPITSLSDVLEADQAAREHARRLIGASTGSVR